MWNLNNTVDGRAIQTSTHAIWQLQTVAVDIGRPRNNYWPNVKKTVIPLKEKTSQGSDLYILLSLYSKHKYCIDYLILLLLMSEVRYELRCSNRPFIRKNFPMSKCYTLSHDNDKNSISIAHCVNDTAFSKQN